MTIFAEALKKDLLDAKMMFDLEREFTLSAIMGNLTNVITFSAKPIEDEKLTLVEELQYFRSELNKHLYLQAAGIGCSSRDMGRALKIVKDLTETDHLE
jgi:hypothetical protein